MPTLKRWRHGHVLALGLACGSSMFAAASGLQVAISAAFDANKARVEVGETFTVRLVLRTQADVAPMRVRMFTKGCAVALRQESSDVRLSLRRAETSTLSAEYRLLTAGECHVFAELILRESAQAKESIIRAATVNRTPTPPVPGAKSGTTADGQRTIDALAGVR